VAASAICVACVSSACGSFGMRYSLMHLGCVDCAVHGGVVIPVVMGSAGWSKLAITVRFIAGAVVVTA
jgi:hypothetical protein